ncbi:hypothetical protein L7F22_051411 [Adiantum nelumboides]|nr:hypothetical protein [Adiantum nelumboides]
MDASGRKEIFDELLQHPCFLTMQRKSKELEAIMLRNIRNTLNHVKVPRSADEFFVKKSAMLMLVNDETRVSPNKKDVCSKRLARCSYVKHPIHLLEEPQVELYLKFKTKYANIQISQRCFESIKLFFVRKLRDRYIYSCIVHIQIFFLKEAVNHMQTQSFDLHASCCMCSYPICLHHDEVVNHGCLTYKNVSMSTTSRWSLYSALYLQNIVSIATNA